MRGKLIVIDGTDGTGKATQTGLLGAALNAEGYPTESRSFPRYGEPSAWFVERYLGGDFGPAQEVPAKLASMFYALDRYAAAPDLRATLERGTSLVLDRYVSANLGHQASKIDDPDERAAFIAWLEDLEYGTCALPKPDMNILLHLDPSFATAAQQLAGKKLDEHEKDSAHLRAAEQTFLEVAGRQHWQIIECAENAVRLSVAEVADRVRAAVESLFPPL